MIRCFRVQRIWKTSSSLSLMLGKANILISPLYICLDLSSVADPGCLSRLLNFVHSRSRISYPIPKNSNKRDDEKNLLSYLFCSHKYWYHKNSKLFYFWIDEDKFGLIYKELKNFLPEKFSLSSQNIGLGSGIGKNLIRIPDPGSKMAPDPGSGSATLDLRFLFHICSTSMLFVLFSYLFSIFKSAVRYS